ncbi:MAG TPA: type I-U CRISPR-associated protein Csb2 [Bryobacteraceae bacterium]|nr:type I-U CRISPR-associated protein Csb2 [Bryobacteraceae bacterium]
MTAIKIIFPWGRYYAHPWGLNPVRLREAEWPPSPWRLLRALASAWFRCHPGCALSQDAAELIETLGRALPEIGFGKVTFGQTVHYQPNYGATADRAEARYKNTRHENHFAAVHGQVVFRWSGVELSLAQQGLLTEMLEEMSYLGRAESICQAEPITVAEIESVSGIGWCRPNSGRKISARCRDVFCPNPEDFRVTDLWARRADNPSVESEEAPKHLVNALLSSDMKVDGAKWVSYEMPDDWPAGRVVRQAQIQKKGQQSVNDGPRIARYLRFSLQCRVPIHSKFTVPLAEQFRSEASRYFLQRFGGDQTSFALFGHQEDRPPDIIGEHQHAFYLPTRSFTDRDDLGWPSSITELHVWCPYGLTSAETQILLRVQRLIWKDGRYPVRPVLTAMGLEPPRDIPLATGTTKSRVWRSETPFVPPRHFLRASGRMRESESPEQQLIACLRQAGITASGEIRRIGLSEEQPEIVGSLPPMPLWSIVRAPAGERGPFRDGIVLAAHVNGAAMKPEQNCQRIGFFMEVSFDTEIAFPMPAVGHSNHFGLGVFVPVART